MEYSFVVGLVIVTVANVRAMLKARSLGLVVGLVIGTRSTPPADAGAPTPAPAVLAAAAVAEAVEAADALAADAADIVSAGAPATIAWVPPSASRNCPCVTEPSVARVKSYEYTPANSPVKAVDFPR